MRWGGWRWRSGGREKGLWCSFIGRLSASAGIPFPLGPTDCQPFRCSTTSDNASAFQPSVYKAQPPKSPMCTSILTDGRLGFARPRSPSSSLLRSPPHSDFRVNRYFDLAGRSDYLPSDLRLCAGTHGLCVQLRTAGRRWPDLVYRRRARPVLSALPFHASHRTPPPTPLKTSANPPQRHQQKN